MCEVQQCDGTVGYGGSPDEAGETTLDAMVIDGVRASRSARCTHACQHLACCTWQGGHDACVAGRGALRGGAPRQAALRCVQTTMNMGAVGALRNVKAAVRAAALVKDHTHHSLLVGDQATAFAVEMGLAFSPLTTQASAKVHRAWLEGACQPNFRARVTPAASATCGPYSAAGDSRSSGQLEMSQVHAKGPGRQLSAQQASSWTHDSGGTNPRPSRRCGQGWPGPGAHDTIAILATDADGHTAAATSTNGNCGKVPGRVGDAAIPGAGAYAVSGVGACGATGDGDVMMRFLPCYQVRSAPA